MDADDRSSQNSLTSSLDRQDIDTPELVVLEMPLAGIGSRFIAILIDYLIWAGIVVCIVIAVFIPAIGPHPRQVGHRHPALPFFLLHWGYFALFEAFGMAKRPASASPASASSIAPAVLSAFWRRWPETSSDSSISCPSFTPSASSRFS